MLDRTCIYLNNQVWFMLYKITTIRECTTMRAHSDCIVLCTMYFWRWNFKRREEASLIEFHIRTQSSTVSYCFSLTFQLQAMFCGPYSPRRQLVYVEIYQITVWVCIIVNINCLSFIYLFIFICWTNRRDVELTGQTSFLYSCCSIMPLVSWLFLGSLWFSPCLCM